MMKRKYSNHIDEYEDIKKKKIDHSITNIEFDIVNIDINDTNCNLDNSCNTNNTDNIDHIQDIIAHDTDNELTNEILKMNNQIIESTNILIKIIGDEQLDLNSLIKFFNHIVNHVGVDKYIQGVYSDDDIQEKFITHYFNLMIYPSYLFQPYLFESEMSTNYIGNMHSNRNNDLKSICFDSKCLFPTWKKYYNFNIDYRFESTHKINKRICKNFTRKIFNFFEKVYYVYFNIVIGNVFTFILSNFILEHLNPYDNKFNKLKFNDWIDRFNNVLINCKKYIITYTNTLKLNQIDTDDKQTLKNKINKVKNDFVDNFSNLIIPINFDLIDNEIMMLFEPIKKFYNQTTSKPFTRTNCLDNIDKEIDEIFKLKNYIKLLDNNSWIKNFSI